MPRPEADPAIHGHAASHCIQKISRTEGDLPYARSGFRHFAADLPYFEERDRGQNWALITLSRRKFRGSYPSIVIVTVPFLPLLAMTLSRLEWTPMKVHDWQVALQGHQIGFLALTVMVWDHIITLGDERELFWKRRPWTLATCLFLWVWGFWPFLDPRRSGCRGVNFIGNIKACQDLFLVLAKLNFARIAALIVGAFAAEILAVILLLRPQVTWYAVKLLSFRLGSGCSGFRQRAVYKGYQRFRTIGHQVLHDILVRDSVMYYLA
ncbi:hypothetical protein B0H14DRAFT_3159744 [Mycena olivaceomarginata]|nr:hypothetical protein B0H14DRAFT_3159744 [Mycena olivaceomarginata]